MKFDRNFADSFRKWKTIWILLSSINLHKLLPNFDDNSLNFPKPNKLLSYSLLVFNSIFKSLLTGTASGRARVLASVSRPAPWPPCWCLARMTPGAARKLPVHSATRPFSTTIPEPPLQPQLPNDSALLDST